MNNLNDWIYWLFPVWLSIVGIYMLIVGLKGIVKGKSFLISARPLMWIMLQGFLPILIIPFWRIFGLMHFSNSVSSLLISYLLIIMFITAIFVYWKQYSGYIAFGVTDESFRDALIYALTELKMPFQESVSWIHLANISADLHVSFASMGNVLIRFKQRKYRTLLKQITDTMNYRFTNSTVQVNMFPYVINSILGVLAIVMALWFGSRLTSSF